MMDLKQKIKSLSILGEQLSKPSESLQSHIDLAVIKNRWFTQESIEHALKAICDFMLDTDVLNQVAKVYALDNYKGQKRVGMVLAGNIPLVGFHDILCTFLCDHQAVIKYSEKDGVLIPYILNLLSDINSNASFYFEQVDRLTDIDAVIATGSNNTAGYFESYFGKYPNIIRSNRNTVAVLSGEEEQDDFIQLGKDIYTYFGLGCRNVSHLLVPRNYKFDFLLGTLHDHYKQVVLHNKFKNNFDFNYATWMMNKVAFLMNGSILISESDKIPSKIATLHYSYYDEQEQAIQFLEDRKDQIQCVVSKKAIPRIPFTKFGEAQSPKFTDYADGVDTIQFLISL